MASYTELIKNDVRWHESNDTSSWPSSVLKFVQSLKNKLKIPSWLKGPVPYTNKRVVDLLDRLRASDDASNADLWDNVNKSFDDETEQRLRVVFNTALLDCARIQAALEAENLTHTPYPKESFLVILVRNAILDVHSELFSLEDVPVVLPRHFSGEANPILKYMKKSFHVPLVISICQDMAVELENRSEAGSQSSDEEDSSTRSELFNHSPPTLSEYLAASDATRTPEDAEEEQGEIVSLPQYDAHFFAYPPSTAPPAVYHIPVLCMADKEQLPLLMSSLLYQRRVWHISDPLIGLEFSKYDTVIRLFVGWLEDDSSSDRVLPRVHLGEIGTPYELDMSLPSVVLVISRFLCSLESHMFAVRDSVRHSVGTVIRETQLYSSLSWRIDTDIRMEDPILENGITRNTIIHWIKSQKYSDCEGTRIMAPRKQAKKFTSSSSATSAPTPQYSTSTRPSHSTSPSSVSSDELNLPIPEVHEPRKRTGDVVIFCSQRSCSDFAATTEENDNRMFRWMFDRKVIPQCLASDLDFRTEYTTMTNFIWPEKWKTRVDLPPVDVALEPCVQELLRSVAALKTRPGAVKSFSDEDSPILQILEQSFSAIFQASRRSREKGGLRPSISEAAWRHDHDRLLFDFFIRLIQPSDGDVDAARTRVGGHSIAHLEDPLSRPNLETTLRFPKSDNLQRSVPARTVDNLVYHRAPDLEIWIQSRGGSPDAVSSQEHDHQAYVVGQSFSWRREITAETEDQMISKLGQFPSTGRCDALGRCLVKLPKVSSKDVGHFPLVVHSAGKKDDGGGTNKAEASADGKTSAKTSKQSLTVPEPSSRAVQSTKGTRYSAPSASFSTSMQSADKTNVCSADSVDALADMAQQLQLGTDSTYLELPILTAEYKKASDDLVKGTNQVRMYLTASVKFLQAVGIRNFPVYGVQTDGPIVSLPAAILRADNFIYLFERLVEKLDISTPLGAWHYATILCRLAENHTRVLEEKFREVRESLCASFLSKGCEMQRWTMDHQIKNLIAVNIGKWPEKEAK